MRFRYLLFSLGAIAFFLISLIALPGRSYPHYFNQPILTAAQITDIPADEITIREVGHTWQQSLNQRNLEAVTSLYTEDAILLPPNAPVMTGQEAIRTSYREAFQLPNFSLTRIPIHFQVSQSRDLAVEFGLWNIGFDTLDAERFQDSGKYLWVLVKVDRDWKIAIEMFSSNDNAE